MSDPSPVDSTPPIVLELALEVPLPERGSIVEMVAHDGQIVCLARLDDGSWTAFESHCPHRGVPLCHGALDADQIICLEHFWRWSVHAGEPVGAQHSPLRTYTVEDLGTSLRLHPRATHASPALKPLS
jgi:nitrite reductase/ring-hydroxylating ferredoxin subunit